MKVVEIFSKRAKKLRGDSPDVYQYDELPMQLRKQITMIWDDALGSSRKSDRLAGVYNPESAYRTIVETLCREYGQYELAAGYYEFKWQELRAWFLDEQDVERCLDAVEISFRIIDRHIRKNYSDWSFALKLNPDDAIKELNYRMKEAGAGYRWESGYIVRVDSELIHSEVIKPVLTLLR